MKPEPSKFEKATEERREGLIRELWGFLASNKKWWLLPIFAAMLIFALLILLSSTGVAPFIYSLF